jgi:phosphoglucomutase
VLAWLSIMAVRKTTIRDILISHWNKYGRNFFSRYDYEEVDSDAANKVVNHLQDTFANQSEFIGKEFANSGKTYKVAIADDFQYTDPIDHSLTTKQVMEILFVNICMAAEK